MCKTPCLKNESLSEIYIVVAFNLKLRAYFGVQLKTARVTPLYEHMDKNHNFTFPY